MADLPAGTVTFVFTDIEDSTELLKRLGDGYGDVLTRHRRIVRDAFAARDGVEMDTQGDAFFFVFRRAKDAAAAAVEVQRAHAAEPWPAGEEVRVRIGLHTGEPAIHEEGYVGLDVVRAARICTVGRGGQILLSETTRALLGSGLPDGVSVFPLGQRNLRGIDEPERVYEIAIDDLEHEERERPRSGTGRRRTDPLRRCRRPPSRSSRATSRAGSRISAPGSRPGSSSRSCGRSRRAVRCRTMARRPTTSQRAWPRSAPRSTREFRAALARKGLVPDDD